MTYLEQSILHGVGEETGDCFRAAVASLLGFERVEDVPHFCCRAWTDEADDAHYWFREFLRWLRGYGLTAVEVPYHPRWAMALEKCTYLLSGPSPRFTETMHTVVAEGPHGEVVHDPHPDNTGVGEWPEDGQWYVMVLFPVQPWRHFAQEGT